MFIRQSKLTCTRMEEGINGLLLVSLGGVYVRRIVKWFDIEKSKHRTSKHEPNTLLLLSELFIKKKETCCQHHRSSRHRYIIPDPRSSAPEARYMSFCN